VIVFAKRVGVHIKNLADLKCDNGVDWREISADVRQNRRREGPVAGQSFGTRRSCCAERENSNGFCVVMANAGIFFQSSDTASRRKTPVERQYFCRMRKGIGRKISRDWKKYFQG